MSFKDRENVYTCSKCGGHTVTIDVDDGVTALMIDCRASGRSGDCAGAAWSAHPPGPRPPRIPPPAWEWYRPGKGEIRRLDRAMREHVKNGGLLLRKRRAAA